MSRSRRVIVHLLHQSAGMEFVDVKNTYQKGDMFCLMGKDSEVFKFPMVHIFRVEEYE